MALAFNTDNLPDPNESSDLPKRAPDRKSVDAHPEENIEIGRDVVGEVAFEMIAWPSLDLSTILSEVKVVRGIAIVQESGQPTDSADIIQFKQDANLDSLNWARRKLKALSEGAAHAGVFNNLGCAYMFLREWIEAEKAFYDAARAPEFADAHEAAEQNHYLLRDARRASD